MLKYFQRSCDGSLNELERWCVVEQKPFSEVLFKPPSKVLTNKQTKV